jgi:hypothetical protein
MYWRVARLYLVGKEMLVVEEIISSLEKAKLVAQK